MNKKIMTTVSFLSLVLSSAVIADTATISQNITMEVEKVLLLDLDNTNEPTLSPTAPTEAGQKFNGWSITNGQSKVLVTSNTSNAKLYVKSDFDFSSENLQLGVALFNSGGSGGSTFLSGTTEEKLADIGMIVTGTTRDSSPLTLSYSATEYNASSSQIPSHGDYTATLTYTIRDN